MSSAPEGPRWWQASDGRWYRPTPPPEQSAISTTEPTATSPDGKGVVADDSKRWRPAGLVWVVALAVLLIGGTVATMVLLSGPDPQPVSVLVIDSTGVANPVPSNLSLTIGTNPQCYPVFSGGKAPCTFIKDIKRLTSC